MTLLYPYIVAAHITVVVFLVGGLLAINRMMASFPDLTLSEQTTVSRLLYRLDHQVVTPALLVTWVLGFTLAFWAGWFPSVWLTAKIVIVVILSALHGLQSGRLRRLIREGTPAQSQTINSLFIVAAMLVIAILVIVKPF